MQMILDAGRIGVAGQALGIGQVRHPVRINRSDYMGLAISIYQVNIGSAISIYQVYIGSTILIYQFYM